MNSYSISKQPAQISLELAKRLALIRKQEGFSQAELAKRSGVSLGSLRRFEQSGKISLEHLLFICQILGRLTEFDQLFQPIEDLAKLEALFNQPLKE
ncbi:MAG: helix-turn-helix transcriptional regulator [Bacteroidota bacterium]